jgi:tyrosyl-tRNA synthetase
MYSQGKIHPLDLKNAVSEELSRLLAPVRDYFSKNKEAQDLVSQLK